MKIDFVNKTYFQKTKLNLKVKDRDMNDKIHKFISVHLKYLRLSPSYG